MKKLRQFCAAVILTVVLALSAFAGDMGFPGATNQVPPPPPETVATDTGDTTSGDEPSDPSATLDPVLEAALSLLQSILSLF